MLEPRAPGSAVELFARQRMTLFRSSGSKAGNGTASKPHHDESCGVAAFFSLENLAERFEPCGLGLATPDKKAP
jgi:hypothetical protein